MRKLIAITQVTLDGVMQSPGGPEEDPSGGFTDGGWAMPYLDESVGPIIGELLSRDFDLLLGRRTYDIWTGYWPHHGDDPIGEAFNRVTKYVATRRSDALSWKTSVALRNLDDLRRLKATTGPELHLWGSGHWLQSLIAADVVDEHHLWVVPIVLGKGKRLFENGVPPRGFSLVSTVTSPKGVLFNAYRPAGPVAKGSA